MSQIFNGLFDSTTTAVIDAGDFILCVAASLALGFLMSFACTYRSPSSKSFKVTIALLPAIVCVVIMMVNGNVGTGVAVAGAFSLVRFRSMPGTAKEIGVLFLAMGTGLITGMGYLAYAAIFTVILSIVFLICNITSFGENGNVLEKTLHITVPESLDYTNMFDDDFAKFTSFCKLRGTKTTNLGSLFKLTYEVRLKKAGSEKSFIDALRCKNGNLEVNLTERQNNNYEL